MYHDFKNIPIYIIGKKLILLLKYFISLLHSYTCTYCAYIFIAEFIIHCNNV